MKLSIRKAVESDHNLIISDWLRSYRNETAEPLAPRHIYFKEHQALIKRHLSLCFVACNSEDEAQVFGWVCGDKSAIHYIYVKLFCRKMGIATALYTHIGSPQNFTHYTKASKKTKLVFNPYLFHGENNADHLS